MGALLNHDALARPPGKILCEPAFQHTVLVCHSCHHTIRISHNQRRHSHNIDACQGHDSGLIPPSSEFPRLRTATTVPANDCFTRRSPSQEHFFIPSLTQDETMKTYPVHQRCPETHARAASTDLTLLTASERSFGYHINFQLLPSGITICTKLITFSTSLFINSLW